MNGGQFYGNGWDFGYRPVRPRGEKNKKETKKKTNRRARGGGVVFEVSKTAAS